jgi:hypothetical protein
MLSAPSTAPPDAYPPRTGRGILKWRGATRNTLATELRESMPAIEPVPIIGAPATPFAAAVSPDNGAAPSSISDIHCGSSTALATGVPEAQLGGTDKPPIGAALPTLASAGPATP